MNKRKKSSDIIIGALPGYRVRTYDDARKILEIAN
jgi:hypothetical protein